MRDTRKQREWAATFVVAGLAAVIAQHFLEPVVKRKAKVRR